MNCQKNTPPWYGLSLGPIIVVCQWNISSPTGPAEHYAGESSTKSLSSLFIHFSAIACALHLASHSLGVCSKVWPQLLIILAAGKFVSSSHTSSVIYRSWEVWRWPLPWGEAGCLPGPMGLWAHRAWTVTRYLLWWNFLTPWFLCLSVLPNF